MFAYAHVLQWAKGAGSRNESGKNINSARDRGRTAGKRETDRGEEKREEMEGEWRSLSCASH